MNQRWICGRVMSEPTFLDAVTPLVLTYNEEPNIARTLSKLGWARRIVVVDSGSTDATLNIASTFPAVRVHHRPFDDFASQWNFGLAQIETPWVLSLDADYLMSDELVREVAGIEAPDAVAGYEARFIYCVQGRPLRAALYPPRVVLFRKACATHINEGHTQRLKLVGGQRRLAAAIYHDDRKPLQRWFASQQRYAREEASYLLRIGSGSLRRTERLRLMAWPAPLLVFAYTLIAKRCILDGWPGWLYVLQRTLAEVMIAIEIVDRRLQGASRNGTDAAVQKLPASTQRTPKGGAIE